MQHLYLHIYYLALLYMHLNVLFDIIFLYADKWRMLSGDKRLPTSTSRVIGTNPLIKSEGIGIISTI